MKHQLSESKKAAGAESKKAAGAESKKVQSGDNVPFWRVVLSVIQASFGVQNKENRERDFKQGNLLAYIVAALLFTAAFVVTLIVVVNLVLSAE